MEPIKETIKSIKNKPKLIVFDLNFTVWNLGQQLEEMNDLLEFLDEEIKIPLSLVTKSSYPEGGLGLLRLYDWMKYFKFVEIYPGLEIFDFEPISSKSNINYEDMLFFDKEEKNIKDLISFDITCVNVDSKIGMNFDELLNGLEVFSKKNSEKSSQ